MHKLYMRKWLTMLKLFLIPCLVQFASSSCIQTSTPNITDYNITDWGTNTWNFRGLDVGASSGDFYHLLSSSTGTDCAVIRENANGTLVWSKQYNTGTECAGLTVDSSENKAYFSSGGTVVTIASLNCTDGALNNYMKINETSLTISEARGRIAITPDGSTVAFAGDNPNSGINGYGCIFDTSGTTAKCINFTVYSVHNPIIISNTEVVFSSIANDYRDIYLESFSIPNLNKVYGWETEYFRNGTSDEPNHFRTSSNSAYLCVAFDFVPGNKVQLHIHSVTNGARIDTRQRSMTYTPRMSSLQIDANSLVWMGIASTSSAFTELIKYDVGTQNYTIYQITGASLFYQFVYGSSSESWYSVAETRYSYYAPLANIANITGFSVTELQDSGFDTDTSIVYSSTTDIYPNTDYTMANQVISDSELTFTVSCEPSEANTTNTTDTNTTDTNTTDTNTTDTNTTATNTTNGNTGGGSSKGFKNLSTSDKIWLGVATFAITVISIGVIGGFVYHYCKKARRARQDRVKRITRVSVQNTTRNHVERNLDSP